MQRIGNVYLVQGTDEALPLVFDFLKKLGIDVTGNPEVYTRSYAHFGIDEARELCERSNAKSLSGERRVFIAVIAAITNEAQNAMLKTLEEPPGDAMFFLIVHAPEMLLPTLRSRAQTLARMDRTESTIDVRAFLKSPPKVRLEMIKPLLEKGEDDRRDISGTLTFLSSLERMLDADSRDGLEAVYRAKAYAGDKGSLLKPLLEHVALLCPVV